MKKSILLFFLFIIPFMVIANDNEVIMHKPTNQGNDQSSYPPPEVTFNDETNTLNIYFNFGGTVTLTCDEGSGYVYDVVYHVYYGTGNTMTLPSLPAGYYTLEVDCGFAGDYIGHFNAY